MSVAALQSSFSFGGSPMQPLRCLVLACEVLRKFSHDAEHGLPLRLPAAGKGYGWWTLEAVFSLWALEAVWQRQVCGSKDGFMEAVLDSLEAVSIFIVGGARGGMGYQ